MASFEVRQPPNEGKPVVCVVLLFLLLPLPQLTMAGSSPLSSWPPSLTPEQAAALSAQATDYALSHGIVYRPIGTPPSSTHVHHAPISLLPSPFPSTAFQTARSLQPILNELYARVALDDAFLEKVIGGSVAKVDEFQNGLWKIYRQVRDEGLEPVSNAIPVDALGQ